MKNNLKFTLIIFTSLFVMISCNHNKNEESTKDKSFNIMNIIFPDAEYTTRYEDGNIKVEAKMINGHPYGIWKKYDNKGALESSIYFFEGKVVVNIDISDYDLKTFFFDKNQLSIKLPTNWLLEQYDINKATIMAIKQMPDNDVFFPTITVTKFNNPNNIDIVDYVKENIKEVKLSFQELVIEGEKMDTSSNDIYELTYSAIYNGSKLGIFSVYYKVNDAIYTVTCIADGRPIEFVKYKDLFKQIAYSLSLKEM